MNRIGIIGAMKIEIELIKNEMLYIDEKVYAGFKFYLGKYKNVDIIVTNCGVGKVNAATCTQILIDKFNVSKIINTGIAGSLNDNVKVYDTVISDNVTYHDVRQVQMTNWFPYKEFFTANKELINLAVTEYKNIESKGNNYHIGRIVSGDSFISDNNLKKCIIDCYKPYCVEMEGAAIGHVAEINEIPFVIIRSISDNADDEATITYEEFEKISADTSAKVVLKMLELLLDS